jgi:hypothetical protein
MRSHQARDRFELIILDESLYVIPPKSPAQSVRVVQSDRRKLRVPQPSDITTKRPFSGLE